MLGVAAAVLRGAPAAPALISQYALDSALATDAVGGVDGTVVGTWTATDTDSLVQGVAGTSFYKNGGTAHITLPAGNATHDLGALTLSFYLQPSASTNKHILFAAGNGTQAGDFSIERLTNGRLRAWHVGQDGVLRFFESTNGITGTNLVVGTAYRIDVSFGAAGAKIYLDGSELAAAAIPANINGWNNARTKYLGIWTDALIDGAEGVFDHVRLWDGQLDNAALVALEAAVPVALPGSEGDWPDPDGQPSGTVFNVSLPPYNAPVAPANATSAIQSAINDARAVGGVVTQNDPPVWNPATSRMEGGTAYRVVDLTCNDPGNNTVKFWRLHLEHNTGGEFARMLKIGNPTSWNASNTGRALVQECLFDGRQTAQDGGAWNGTFSHEHQHALFCDDNSRVTVRHSTFLNTAGDGISMSHGCDVDTRYTYFESCFRGGHVCNVGRVDLLAQDFIYKDGAYGCGVDVELFTNHTGNMIFRSGLGESDFDCAHNPTSDSGNGADVLFEDVIFTKQRTSFVGARGTGTFTWRRCAIRVGDLRGSGNDRSRIHRPRHMLFDDCDIYITDADYKSHTPGGLPNSTTIPDGEALGWAINIFSENDKDLEFRNCRFHLEIVSGSHPITGLFVQNGVSGSTIRLTAGCTFDAGVPPISYGGCTLEHDGTTSPGGHWTGSGPVVLI